MALVMRTLVRPLRVALLRSSYQRALPSARVGGKTFCSANKYRSQSTQTAGVVVDSPFEDLSLPLNTSLAAYMLDDFLRYGELPAFVNAETGVVNTYAQLTDEIVKVSSALVRHGIQKHDVVTLFSTNCHEFAVVYLAASALGATVSTLNPTYMPGELHRALVHSRSRLLITSNNIAKVAKEAVKNVRDMKLIVFGRESGCQSYEELLQDDGARFPDIAVAIDTADDVAALPYSSGTTGLPKGVMLTHDNLVNNIEQILNDHIMPLTIGEDALLGLLPFYHIYGQVVIFMAGLKAGAKVVNMTSFNPQVFLDSIQSNKITYMHLVPPIMLFLAQHPLVNDYDLSSAHTIFTAAAPCSLDVIHKVSERLDLPRVRQAYGLTEASPLTHANPIEDYRYHTCGPAIQNTRYKVVDLETGESLGPGKEGEICIQGPQIMKGYLDNPIATADTIRDGWLHTGDLGYHEEDGHMVISDRLKELIKYKGFQVAPAELEALLLSHPAIVDAAVIGKPDERAGELPRAYVVLKPNSTASEEEIANFVAGQVGTNKHLRGGVEFRSEIPKTASGKILRRVLKDELEESMKDN